jgi:hypothetical protein
LERKKVHSGLEKWILFYCSAISSSPAIEIEVWKGSEPSAGHNRLLTTECGSWRSHSVDYRKNISSWEWRRVFWYMSTDVAEGCTVSVFKAEEYAWWAPAPVWILEYWPWREWNPGLTVV